MFQKSFSILIYLLLCGCAGSSKRYTASIDDNKDMVPKILFISFLAKKDAAGNTQITLLQTQESKGKFKAIEDSESMHLNRLIAEVRTHRKPYQTVVVEHPLHKEIEYLANDSTFVRKQVRIDQGEFFFRIKMPEFPAEIVFFEIIGEMPKRYLQKISLSKE